MPHHDWTLNIRGDMDERSESTILFIGLLRTSLIRLVDTSWLINVRIRINAQIGCAVEQKCVREHARGKISIVQRP